MPLELISGPPNSGRTGEVMRRLEAALGRDPVLVLPTRDDADRFERELTAAGSAMGASILTFAGLFNEVIEATGADPPPPLTDAQRQRVAVEAARRAALVILARSAGRPGFAPAVVEMLDEVQAAGADPATLTAAAAGAGDYERELAALFEAYAGVSEELGRGDQHLLAATATSALRSGPDAWGGRPVLLYGFDDLSPEQLELVAALAAGTEVTVAVTYEDRPALTARASLRSQLVEELGGRIATELRPDPANTASEILFHLERGFMEPGAEPRAADDGLAILESAGERSEAEAIAAEAARLIADGEPPGEIAIVLRQPERHADLYRRLLSSYGVPAAVESQRELTATATGRGLVALLRAALTGRGAGDLIAFLRTPGRAHPDQVDWLERAVLRGRLRTADEALEHWRGRELFEVGDLRRAGSDGELLAEAARLARMTAQYPLKRRGELPGAEGRLELRAGEVAASALEELAELGLPCSAAEAIMALEGLGVDLWHGSTEGRVRVISPYAVRGRRVRHLFVASLQGGEFPRRRPPATLLTEESRERLGLPARVAQDDEERYLFYVCLSRPSRRLYLSWSPTDEDGAAIERSPFLDEVRGLIAPPPPRRSGDPDPGIAPLVSRRDLRDVCLEPGRAPSPVELARGVALAGTAADAVLGGLDLEPDVAAEVGHRLAAARARADCMPRDLTAPAALEELAGRDPFGASTLEEYATCSYRWFVRHELDPRPLGPDPEPLAHGGAVHAVLEALYREPPGPDPVPRPQTLPAWQERARDLLAEAAESRRLAPRDAASHAGYARMEAMISRFLAAEAGREMPLRPDPALIEARFGDTDEDGREALQLDGFRLHGRIDRVDTEPGAAAGRGGLIHDYKASAKATPGKKLAEEGKLQLPLYMEAARELWHIHPLGGLYHPLRQKDRVRPRGLVRSGERERLLDDGGLYKTDFFDDEEFEGMIADARRRAAEVVAAIRSGRVRRDPLGGECPWWCEFQPICRKERSIATEREQAEEESRRDPATENGG